MSGFSAVERNIAGFLSKHPGLKKRLKKLYSSVNYMIYKKDYSYKTDMPLEKIVSDSKNESFFGYYDRSPENSGGKLIVFHETEGSVSHLPPGAEKPLKIMLFEKGTDKYERISETRAYNWQQGSKLMWLNGSEFIFNDISDGKAVSRIFHTADRSSRTLDMPVYDCYRDEFALSLSFERLNFTDPDYGYPGLFKKVIKDTGNDGIFYIDLRTGEQRLILSLKKIIELHPSDGSDEKDHCVNHIMISPDGKNFIFIHRWFRSGERLDSLLVCDIEGMSPRILSDGGFVSHCCWSGSGDITGYLHYPSCGKNFYTINIESGQVRTLSEKLSGFGDGHPSFCRNKMLFDSYPDRSRMQHLYLLDTKTEELDQAGSFLSPLRFFGPTRCDLHPKWSSDGKSIFIDSAHEGKRFMFKIIL